MDYRSCNGVIYTIKPGDTLYKISARYGIPLALILRANQYIDIYNLRIGDRICVPTGGMPIRDVTYTVGEKDTIQDILKRFNLTPKEFLQANPLDKLYLKPGSVVMVPKMPGDVPPIEEEPGPVIRDSAGTFDGKNLNSMTENELKQAYNRCH